MLIETDVTTWARPRAISKPRRGSLDDVPQTELAYMTVKIYFVGALAWDYTDTVLDIASQMKISETKKLSRTIRELRRNYDRLRAIDLDAEHIRQEWKLAELFEAINKEHISRLCNGLLTEIRHDHKLSGDYESLVEAVLIALTMLDALHLYADQCDAFIKKYYPDAPHSILPDHFTQLKWLLPEYAGDCYYSHSKARDTTARILLNEINRIELYE